MNKALFPALVVSLAVGLSQLTRPQVDSFAEAASSPSDSVLSLGSATSHPMVFAGSPQDVYLYLSLKAQEIERPKKQRPSMNLALVIDRSGSMASEDKLLYAKSAAEQLVGRLQPNDHLSIAVYDTTVQTIVGSTPGSERELFLAAIRGIQSGNSTNLHGGMMAGYEEALKHYDVERMNRVLLLSDGMANEGETDPLKIRARASQCRKRGGRISTMGMGLAYDEDLMSGIAQSAGGNYYYVGDPESVGRHLDQEIDELSRVVARDIELKLKLAPGVRIAEAFGYSHSVEGRVVSLPIPDMIDDERRKVVIRLRVRGPAGRRSELATARLEFVDAHSNESGALQNDVLVHSFTNDIQQVELFKRMDVLIKVEVVRNAEAIMAAMELQKVGNYGKAQELLRARYRNCKLINDTEYRSAELIEMLQNMKQMLHKIEATKANPVTRRDFQLDSGLQALGYIGDD